MKKFFVMTFLLATFFCATAFAAEEEAAEEKSKGFEYTSQTFGFKITCPAEPKVVVNPFPDPAKRGELLVFANDGATVLYGYQIQFDAFRDTSTPDFNKADKKILEAYLEKLKVNGAYEDAIIDKIAPGIKGVLAVTAKEIEIKDDSGVVVDVATASTQNEIAFFRTKSGKRISIQPITNTLDDEVVMNFRKSLATFQDPDDLKKKKKK